MAVGNRWDELSNMAAFAFKERAESRSHEHDQPESRPHEHDKLE